MRKTLFAACVYVSAIMLANLLVAKFGPWFSLINSFFLIGLDLSLRDSLHERLGMFKVMGLVVLSGTLSYLLNPAAGMIAVASAVSFVLANLADTAVYQKFIQKRWLVKSNLSNLAGAAVDSALFPLIAFGAFMPGIILGQFLAKVAGGSLWSLIINYIKYSK